MSLQAMTTLAFLLASILAVSLPRPLLAPVTMNTRPLCDLALLQLPHDQDTRPRTRHRVATSGSAIVRTRGMTCSGSTLGHHCMTFHSHLFSRTGLSATGRSEFQAQERSGSHPSARRGRAETQVFAH